MLFISFDSVTAMKRVLLGFLLILPFFSKASHIVGGEFELLHLTGNSYRLNLILYFDLNNGLAGAKDQFADVISPKVQAKTKAELKSMTESKLALMSQSPSLLRGIFFRCCVSEFFHR